MTIRNGTVTFFLRGGVLLVGVDRNRVQDLTMDFFDEFAIQLEEGGSGNRFAGNTITRAGDLGIGIRGTATASRDNQVSGNSVISANNAGITLRYGTIAGTLIEDNTVEETDTRDQWGAGIAVGARYTTGEGAYRGTVVRGNRMDTLFGGGVFAADAATDTLVERNRVDDSYGCRRSRAPATAPCSGPTPPPRPSSPVAPTSGSTSTSTPRATGSRRTPWTGPAAPASTTAAPARSPPAT